MEPKKFGRILRVSLLIPVLLILSMAGIVAWEVMQLRTALGWVDHTDRVIAEARLTLRSIVDEETGVRGYLLTRRDDFLQPYNAAVPRVEEQFAKLPPLVADNPEQLSRLQQLRDTYDRWLADSKVMLSQTPVTSSTNLEAQPPSLEPQLQGKQLMDDIRAQMDEFMDAEYRLRDERVRRSADLDKVFFSSLHRPDDPAGNYAGSLYSAPIARPLEDLRGGVTRQSRQDSCGTGAARVVLHNVAQHRGRGDRH